MAREGHLELVNSDHPDPEPLDERSASGDAGPAAGRGHVPKTRTGAAWVGVCLAALIAIALIVFLAQNTRRVHVSFLWMDATTPLALALLIAAVAAALLMLVIGTARILQLRKSVHQQRP